MSEISKEKHIHTKKIFIVGGLFIAFLLTLFISRINLPFTSVVFSDVNSDNPFFDAISYLKENDFISGYSDNTYKPNNGINRAEFVKIIIGTIYTENEIAACVASKTFSDVKQSDWFYPYVCVAANNGIVNGYSDGSFKPGNPINFAESAKIIVNAFGYKTSTKELWYQSYVEKLEELNAIPSSICSISKNITRGEMAEMIYRLKEEITDKSGMTFFSESADAIQSTTFLKSYRVKDMSETYDIKQTSDGGYVITGHTVNQNELCGYGMFWIKADKFGNKSWSKLFNNCNSDGYAITQLTDGNYIAAGGVVDFRTDAEQETLEGQGDNLLVKIDGSGNTIWARTVSQQSIDAPFKLQATENGGFVMSGLTGVLVGQPDVADINHTPELGNFSSDGELNWFKKIEGEENMGKSVSQTSDGGYIMIGNIKLVEENDQKVPALVKLDESGEFKWATGLENLPIEIPNLIMNPDGKSFTVGTPNKMHLSFGDFIRAEQTSDGGYVALGRYFSAISTAALNNLTANAFKESSFVAVKVDSKGKLKWARAIKIKKYLEEPVMEKTEDGGYIIMGNNYANMYADLTQAAKYDTMMEEYYAKYPPTSAETAESKAALQAISNEIESWQGTTMIRNIVLVKLDENFNYQWGKVIGGTKDLDGYAITQTTDSGYAIAGTWHTGIKRRVMTSILEYTEAMILKLDANGNLGNDNGLVTDFSDIELSDVSVYVVTDDLSSPELVTEYAMDNVVRSINVSNKDGVTTTASEPSTYKTAICNADVPNIFNTGTGGTGGGTGDTPVTKTRAQMKYDETVEITAKTTKGITVNDELTPILNDTFENQVKLWDEDVSGWVAYRFSRLVTTADIQEIKTALEELSYSIDSNDNGDFTATKVGMTLNLHFYLGDTNQGRLDVMF
jgi:hypothetical protein